MNDAAQFNLQYWITGIVISVNCFTDWSKKVRKIKTSIDGEGMNESEQLVDYISWFSC